MRLFWLEFKRFTTSLAFILYTIVTAVFILLNVWPMIGRGLATPPTSPTAHYELITTTDFHPLKTNALDQLQEAHTDNAYVTYPFGFAKRVTLNAQVQAKVGKLLNQARRIDNRPTLAKTLGHVDQLLGGHSDYAPATLQRFAVRPMTLAEARQDHTLIMRKDRITGAYARLFADIAGIIAAILPTIVIIAYCYIDRRAQVMPTIQAKPMGTLKWLGTQYAASVAGLIIPVIIAALALFGRVTWLYPGVALDYLAFAKAACFWVLPTLMVSTAVGFLSDALFSNFTGFALQIGWWLIVMTIGARQVIGNYGWLLIPRHNTLHNVAYFYAHLSELAINRLGYTILAITLLILTMLLINLQREGKYRGLHIRPAHH
ncbi:ABC transporter permease [Schleiferilactobacillus perolens]|uniref:ABC transporter permease n=1 Tax=Schleiferilactobacillus perolens DSM 12744 TaxID=1423792 RepID=A0A0R1MT22_9LACO|nr:ABC transporter permease [Schleiferilactobacillus perolens]KRL11342.1 hypothetical protein FD09_GL000711 [Schleiferilactobacillus perolens DSM 12744]